MAQHIPTRILEHIKATGLETSSQHYLSSPQQLKTVLTLIELKSYPTSMPAGLHNSGSYWNNQTLPQFQVWRQMQIKQSVSSPLFYQATQPPLPHNNHWTFLHVHVWDFGHEILLITPFKPDGSQKLVTFSSTMWPWKGSFCISSSPSDVITSFSQPLTHYWLVSSALLHFASLLCYVPFAIYDMQYIRLVRTLDQCTFTLKMWLQCLLNAG